MLRSCFARPCAYTYACMYAHTWANDMHHCTPARTGTTCTGLWQVAMTEHHAAMTRSGRIRTAALSGGMSRAQLAQLHPGPSLPKKEKKEITQKTLRLRICSDRASLKVSPVCVDKPSTDERHFETNHLNSTRPKKESLL